MKGKREYRLYIEKSIESIRSAIDSFNRVHDQYKIETCLFLLTNAWELLGKGILIKKGINIRKDRDRSTISAEIVVVKLRNIQIIDDNQADCLQQIISLRNEATHNLLPPIPEEILHHLFYFACKFFKDIISKTFQGYEKEFNHNFLSISFSNLTTYADKLQKVVGRFKKNKNDRKLTWLLERGMKFEEGTEYKSQVQFEKEYRTKSRILPHLNIGKFIKNTEMVRLIPIQAPRNFTADITLRKGSSMDSSLPVQVRRTEIESDYPFMTKELANKLGKNPNFIATMIKNFGYKGNTKYHQSVRSSKSSSIQRYSNAVLKELKEYLDKYPNYNPYKPTK
jgi:hypothetical protein